MKKPAFKIVVAAAAVAAVIVAVSQFGGSIDGTGVAWGRVAELIEGMPPFIHRESRVTTCDGETIPFMSSDNVVTHFSLEHGYREDMYDQEGQLLQRVYVLPAQKRSVTLIPPLRQYRTKELDSNKLSTFKMGFSQIVEHIKSGEYSDLGTKVINGIEAEGIEFTDTFLQVDTAYPIKFDRLLIRLWVDVETSLPIRMEAEATTTDKFLTNWTDGKPIDVKAVVDEFQWNAEIDPKVFEPEIPDDFALVTD